LSRALRDVSERLLTELSLVRVRPGESINRGVGPQRPAPWCFLKEFRSRCAPVLNQLALVAGNGHCV